MDYDKKKDVPPAETAEKILKILKNIGINIQLITMNPDNNPYPLYSCRVYTENSIFGTNGKGTTLNYSIASALGEFMERFQNNCLIGVHPENYPDSKIFNKNDFLYNKECVSLSFFKKIYILNQFFPSSEDILDKIISDCYKQGKIYCLKYYNVNKNKCIYLPSIVQWNSNGMSAGNTPEEAIVQGISEVIERYVSSKIHLKKYIPPVIPEKFYMKYDTITNIVKCYKSMGLEIQVRDLSFGQGLPAVCVILIDKKTARYTIHFGAHPVLPIAIERTFTEISQGIDMGTDDIREQFYWSDISTDKKYFEYTIEEIQNFFKYGYTQTNPYIFLKRKPSWEFNPDIWIHDSSITNKQILMNLVKMLKSNKYDIYVRDSSFLGFPAFHVYIPQMSNTFLKCIKNTDNIDKNYKYQFDENSKTMIKYFFITANPIIQYCKAAFYLINHLYADALKHLEKVENIQKNKYFDEKEIKCLKYYLRMKVSNYSEDEILEILKYFYDKKLISATYEQWINAKQPLSYWKETKEFKLYRKIYNKIKKFFIENNKEGIILQENISEIF